MDEFWATFDAAIFRRGQLIATIPQAYRRFASALQPVWRLPTAGSTAWASTYLPLNAATRAALSLVGLDGWASAIWSAIGSVAVYGVARQMWPARRDAAVVALLLVASSSQLLVMAMTPYAMAAHFALNMVWLLLFLQRRWWSIPAALGVGAIACGVHQLVFHLLFVAPFIVELGISKRFKAAASLALGYGVIALFWMSYWAWMLPLAGARPAMSEGVGGGWFAERVLELLRAFKIQGAATMAENLFRFAAWQNPLFLPLIIAGGAVAMRTGMTLRPLLIGSALTVGAMFVLLPYQGHGWGYRYLHGHLGALALVAAAGWVSLTSRASGLTPWRGAETTLLASVLFSLVVLLPIHALQAHQFALPYARAQAVIAHSSAEIVLVDQTGLWFGQDMVQNDPYLQRRPKVMLLDMVNIPQIQEVCRAHSWEIFGKHEGVAVGIISYPAQASTAVLADLALLRSDPSCRRGSVTGLSPADSRRMQR